MLACSWVSLNKQTVESAYQHATCPLARPSITLLVWICSSACSTPQNTQALHCFYSCVMCSGRRIKAPSSLQPMNIRTLLCYLLRLLCISRVARWRHAAVDWQYAVLCAATRHAQSYGRVHYAQITHQYFARDFMNKLEMHIGQSFNHNPPSIQTNAHTHMHTARDCCWVGKCCMLFGPLAQCTHQESAIAFA